MVPADADRAPNLDDILARLTALASPEPDAAVDDRAAAPVPESAETRREPILDLTRIAEATERLTPAGLATEASAEGASPTLDYGAGVDVALPIDEPVIDLTPTDPATGPDEVPLDTSTVIAETENTGDTGAVIDLIEPETIDVPPAVRTAVDEASADVVTIDDESVEEAVPTPSETPEPVSVAPARDLIDVRPPERRQPSAPSKVRKPAAARPPNPFRRLILWSVALGIALLIVAGVVIVT